MPRLFVAADLSDATRRACRRVREQLEPGLAAARVPPRVVWVSDDAVHVTLRFIGDVSKEDALAIEEALCPTCDVGSFDVEWASLGTFPPSRSPRVLWLGATSDIGPMRQLAQLVSARVDPIVGPTDSRPYTPHVTLARIRNPGRGVDWARALTGVSLEPTVSHADHITLYESHVGQKGSTYTVRMRAPLI